MQVAGFSIDKVNYKDNKELAEYIFIAQSLTLCSINHLLRSAIATCDR